MTTARARPPPPETARSLCACGAPCPLCSRCCVAVCWARARTLTGTPPACGASPTRTTDLSQTRRTRRRRGSAGTGVRCRRSCAARELEGSPSAAPPCSRWWPRRAAGRPVGCSSSCMRMGRIYSSCMSCRARLILLGGRADSWTPASTTSRAACKSIPTPTLWSGSQQPPRSPNTGRGARARASPCPAPAAGPWTMCGCDPAASARSPRRNGKHPTRNANDTDKRRRTDG